MRDCIFQLLKARDGDSLECLCRLLATIGKDMDDKARVSNAYLIVKPWEYIMPVAFKYLLSFLRPENLRILRFFTASV
jgi:hypothetical protein